MKCEWCGERITGIDFETMLNYDGILVNYHPKCFRQSEAYWKDEARKMVATGKKTSEAIQDDRRR